MIRPAVEHLDVHVGASPLGEAFEEIRHELGLEIADLLDLYLEVDDSVHATREVDRRDAERLVHRHHEVAGAIDSPTISQRHRYRFAEGDADIFDGVVLVDIEVALGRDLQIESTVPGDELQHVIEESDPGADVIASAAVQLQAQSD